MDEKQHVLALKRIAKLVSAQFGPDVKCQHCGKVDDTIGDYGENGILCEECANKFLPNDYSPMWDDQALGPANETYQLGEPPKRAQVGIGVPDSTEDPEEQERDKVKAPKWRRDAQYEVQTYLSEEQAEEYIGPDEPEGWYTEGRYPNKESMLRAKQSLEADGFKVRVHFPEGWGGSFGPDEIDDFARSLKLGQKTFPLSYRGHAISVHADEGGGHTAHVLKKNVVRHVTKRHPSPMRAVNDAKQWVNENSKPRTLLMPNASEEAKARDIEQSDREYRQQLKKKAPVRNREITYLDHGAKPDKKIPPLSGGGDVNKILNNWMGYKPKKKGQATMYPLQKIWDDEVAKGRPPEKAAEWVLDKITNGAWRDWDQYTVDRQIHNILMNLRRGQHEWVYFVTEPDNDGLQDALDGTGVDWEWDEAKECFRVPFKQYGQMVARLDDLGYEAKEQYFDPEDHRGYLKDYQTFMDGKEKEGQEVPDPEETERNRMEGPGAVMSPRVTTAQRTLLMCNECGHKFKKNLGRNTFEVKCPKCGGYDTEPGMDIPLTTFHEDPIHPWETSNRRKRLEGQSILPNPSDTTVVDATDEMEDLREQSLFIQQKTIKLQAQVRAYGDALANKIAQSAKLPSGGGILGLQQEVARLESELNAKLKALPQNFIQFADGVTMAKVQVARLNDPAWKQMIDTARIRGSGVMKKVTQILDNLSGLFQKLTVDIHMQEFGPGEFDQDAQQDIVDKNVQNVKKIDQYQQNQRDIAPRAQQYFVNEATGRMGVPGT